MIENLSHILETPAPLADELTFLTQHTGQNEASILVQALQVGLNLLYHQAIEQLFIDTKLSRLEAVNILGEKRVAELEYAQRALVQDIAQGLKL